MQVNKSYVDREAVPNVWSNMSPPGDWVQRANRSDNTDKIFLSIYLQKGYKQAVKRVKKAKTKETDGQTL